MWKSSSTTYPSKVQHSCRCKSTLPEQVLWSPRCPAFLAQLQAHPVLVPPLPAHLWQDIMDGASKQELGSTNHEWWWIWVNFAILLKRKPWWWCPHIILHCAFCFAKLLIPSLSKQREDANDANGNVRSPLQTPTIQFVWDRKLLLPQVKT
jgi:hypothetical protein